MDFFAWIKESNLHFWIFHGGLIAAVIVVVLGGRYLWRRFVFPGPTL